MSLTETQAELSGFYYDMDFETYAAVDALNGSSIVNMRRSPMYYRHMLDNPQPATPAMVLGTATHRMVLEPEKVGDIAVWGLNPQEKVRNGNVWETFKADNAGKLIVTKAERDQMVGMAVGARRNVPIVKYANAKGNTEVSMFWRDSVTNRRMKGRADKIIPSTHTIFDLKTCRSCERYKFGSQSFQLGYHIKMAMYWNGYKVITGHEPHLKLGAIESKAPYESAVYRVTSDVLSQGFEDLDILLRKLAACEESGEWPAAEVEECELSMPSYAFSDPADDLSDLELVEG